VRQKSLWWGIVLAVGIVTVFVPWGYAQVGGPTGDMDKEQVTLFGENLSLQVGYKVWVAKWQTWNSLAGGPDQMISKFSPLQGPQATLTFFKRFFISGQYLASNFEFHGNGVVGDNQVLRSDLTVTAGARVWKGLGIFAGHYRMLQHFSPTSSFRLKGPVVGIFGTAPIEDTPASMYFNVATGWLTFHPGEARPIPGGNLRTEGVRAYSGELGINVAGPSLWRIGTSAQIGYRYQIIEQSFGSSGTGLASERRANDVTHGPVFMLSAIF
jgi:hypothetical protein